MFDSHIGEALIYAVRHGETELNAGNKFRGFVDVELDDQGMEQAEQAREFLKDVQFVAAYCSDLKRAAVTAKTILKGRDMGAQHLAAMRPWNVGMFTGKAKTEKNKQMLRAYANSPDIPIPEGESLNEFRSRYGHVFQERIDEAIEKGGPVLMVQHASNDHEVGNIVYGDIDAVDVDPGGIVAIYLGRNGLEAKAVLNEATEATKGFGKS